MRTYFKLGHAHLNALRTVKIVKFQVLTNLGGLLELVNVCLNETAEPTMGREEFNYFDRGWVF